MAYEPPKPKIEMQEIRYYLDAQRQDHFDRGAVQSKNSQILELRTHLLSLPHSEFETAMHTLRKIVVNSPSDKGNRHGDQFQRNNATLLYDMASKAMESPASGNTVQAI